MTIVKLSTKRGQKLLATADNYEGYKLSDVYGSYSRAKERAFEWCFRVYINTYNAYDFHICAHNSQTFSVAWCITSTETGEVIYTRIETAYNSYLIDHNA